MITEHFWIEAMKNLLEHFDDNEGTTYLYDENARQRFLSEMVDPAIRPQVSALMEEYHKPKA